jgi:transposase-like protein
MKTTHTHRLSTAEGFALIARYYQQGGHGARQFYTSHGLTENQFYGWRKRYNRTYSAADSIKETAAGIRPLEIIAPALPASIEIEYVNGNRLRLSLAAGISMDLVRQLLQLTTRV